MNHTLELLLLLLSAITFAVAFFNPPMKVNLVAFGLFAWVLTVLIPQIK